MRSLLKLVLLVATGAAAASSEAHFLWATIDVSAHRFGVQFAQSPGDSVVPNIADKASATVVTVEGKPFAMALKEGDLTAAAMGDAFGAALAYGRFSEGESVFRLDYYAKAATSVKASQISQKLRLEISALDRSGNQLKAKVEFDGKPATGCEVVAIVNSGDDEVTATTDGKGIVTIEIPEGQPAVLRALMKEKKSGTIDGKSYDEIRSYSTLTLPS